MNRESRAPKLVAFDVDGTMMPSIPDNNTGRAFWRMNEEGLLDIEDKTLKSLWSMREEIINSIDIDSEKVAAYDRAVVDVFDSSLKGIPKNKVENIFEEQADYLASEEIYPEIYEEIQYWRRRNATLAMISGSPDIFINALKHRLGFDKATGTRHYFVKDEDKNTRVFRNRPSKSRVGEKHLIADKMRLTIGEGAIFAAAYGDTISDIKMMEQAVEKISVNPTPELLDKSIEDNWRILYTEENRSKSL